MADNWYRGHDPNVAAAAASACVQHLEARGWRFRDGAAAALTKAFRDQVDTCAAVDVLHGFRLSVNPAWDGSIA